MNDERFRALTDELLPLAGAPASDHLYAGVVLDVDEVSFSLMHSGAPDDDRIEMFCDFGEPPPHTKAEAVKALLAANADVLGNAGLSNFCMNRLTGHILVSSVLSMRRMTAVLLLDQLRSCAQDAKNWQRKYSLRTRRSVASATAA